MPLDIYTPHELYAVMFDPRQTVSTSQWLNMFFPRTFFSTQEEIMFDKIDASRPIAPFMLPNIPGRPIFRREGEQIRSFRPAYTKPKDAVRPGEMLEKGPGELTGRLPLQSPQARYDAEVIRITRYHRDSIQRLWDYMAAIAIIEGQITISYATDAGAPAQSVVIDFGRNADHTVTKATGSQWGDSGVNPFDDVQEWIDRVALAEFGGSVQDVLMGANAAKAFMNSDGVREKLHRDVRGADDVNFNRGIVRTDPMNPMTYIGTGGDGTRFWRVSGPGNKFQRADGTYTDILDTNKVVAAAPNVDGIQAFGAILDQANNLAAQDIFPKMWDEQDPSARFIMSQSAPLMIPTNPNATLTATVTGG